MPSGIYKSSNRRGGTVGRSGTYKRTELHKNNTSKALKGRKLSKEHKDRIKQACLEGRCGTKGKKFTKETKEKISKKLKGNTNKRGTKTSEETKKKQSKAKLRENHWNWKGGISGLAYGVDWTNTLRRSIRERDKYTCQICSKQQGDKAFCVHHIDYDKENCNPINLILLCDVCHTKTNYNREYWEEYLSNKRNDNN